MDATFAEYGTVSKLLGGKHAPTKLGREAAGRSRPAFPVFVGCVFVPWLLFTTTFWLRSFELRKDSEAVANVLCFCLLLPAMAFVVMTYNLTRSGDPKPMGFLALTSLLAWCLGFLAGDSNYIAFMRPYYDINSLNVYPSVDASKYVGAQLMDAGMIQFKEGTKLLLEKSVGFKNDEVYCVAPIASNLSSTQTTYDFWAVGINCCSGHLPHFHCGEYTNPLARWGLRLMDDSKRDMFRLAVKEASASFNLNAPHPVFLYWMSDPTSEVNAYQDDGFKFFLLNVFGCFSVQLFLVVLAASCFAKM